MQNFYSNISYDQFKEKCNEHDLKITPQRIAIYQELQQAKDHPSCDDIFQRIQKDFPHISFDTVYRTLMTFAEIGIIKVVEGYGEKKRFDPNLENHHHLRCFKCNTIIDFTNSSYDDLAVPQELKKKFKIINKKVVLEGICHECQSK